MKNYDVIVVGCGVIGAAAAFELSKYELKVGIIEKENDVSLGATRANSAIIHAGFDPEPGSLMARLNVRGSELTGDIAKMLDVSYERIGAMVIALSEDEIPVLEGLLERGNLNGVKGLRLLDAGETRKMEPEITPDAACALYVPTSAIISPWEYCLALTETAILNGAELNLNCEVKSIERKSSSDGEGWFVRTSGGDFFAPLIVNAAGVNAIDIHNLAAEKKYVSKPRIGEYFLLDKSEGKRVRHTIFQCPNEFGKGVLVSVTTHGNLIVGPNSTPAETGNTACSAEGLAFVRERAKRSVPGIDFRKNIRNFAGLRATTDSDDFIIGEAADGFMDCAGICSPGLSAAPAIAEYVVELIGESLKKTKKCGLGDSLAKKKDFRIGSRKLRFNSLSEDEKAEVVKNNPAYGRVICRCETITEGEILDTFKSLVPPVSIDGIKRRTGTGMGRCQGGFCAPRIAELLVEELGYDVNDIIMDREGSEMFFGRTKGGARDV